MAGTVMSAYFHHSRRTMLSAILHRSPQKFDIALGPGDPALSDAQYAPALRTDPFGRPAANTLVNKWVTHHSALADFHAPGLELRLDQRDEHGARPRQTERRR